MIHDLLIIGGGINGSGIARDAAGRGLSVVLCEQGDIGGATSSASSKLIHGGLRYLEHFAFGLVAESLAEREILLHIAPHLTRPRRFVLPDADRPRWQIAVGLLLYDRLGSLRRRRSLPASRRINLGADPRGAALKPECRDAFVYSDVTVDDARLTLANARDAAARGAVILPRSRVVAARRETETWQVTVQGEAGSRELAARALINAAGPWAGELSRVLTGSAIGVRLVRGSHIVVPRLYEGNHAYTLQNDDGRVCFVLPFQRDYSLIGTTDVDVKSPAEASCVSDEEIEYLCLAVNRYLKRPVSPHDVAWSFAGVRPLIDDRRARASTVSREYRLLLDRDARGALPLLTVIGGKLTTYRRLAEAALVKLKPWFRDMGPPWTAERYLPGGDLADGSFDVFVDRLCKDRPALPRAWLEALAGRHGGDCTKLLGNAEHVADLGCVFGGGLFEREAAYCIANEWATEPDDVLWRRTKCGLSMSVGQRAEFAAWFHDHVEGGLVR